MGERSIDTHEGKAKFDEDIMLHANELKAFLIEKPIADHEKDIMAFITEQKRSHLEGLVKDQCLSN